MTFYAEMQAIAASVFQEFAQGTVVHRRQTAGAGTPENPGVGVPVNTTLNGATVSGVTARELLGTQVKSTDLVVRFAADQISEVRLTDVFVLDGVPHTVVSVETKPAVGTPVAHAVVVRA